MYGTTLVDGFTTARNAELDRLGLRTPKQIAQDALNAIRAEYEGIQVTREARETYLAVLREKQKK